MRKYVPEEDEKIFIYFYLNNVFFLLYQSKHTSIPIYLITVGENIIGAPKMQNYCWCPLEMVIFPILGYCKAGRAITKWGAIEKNQMLLLEYWKNLHFYMALNLIWIYGAPIIFFPNYLFIGSI